MTFASKINDKMKENMKKEEIKEDSYNELVSEIIKLTELAGSTLDKLDVESKKLINNSLAELDEIQKKSNELNNVMHFESKTDAFKDKVLNIAKEITSFIKNILEDIKVSLMPKDTKEKFDEMKKQGQKVSTIIGEIAVEKAAIQAIAK